MFWRKKKEKKQDLIVAFELVREGEVGLFSSEIEKNILDRLQQMLYATDSKGRTFFQLLYEAGFDINTLEITAKRKKL